MQPKKTHQILERWTEALTETLLFTILLLLARNGAYLKYIRIPLRLQDVSFMLYYLQHK